ncbi:hypothetical protein [Hymenobacter wooponensis]|uniref:Uncharacterized protein n=1 Tax=Hymenobacter wooponensis TaxID=1525360 RepID=A0A4Z0MSS6_9BACT|nr:hypothetical protein [Hymenobacter wooponensis]TGD82862.1 hypothetical protein EU557_03520 [Hymenobacter wooponensis]
MSRRYRDPPRPCGKKKLSESKAHGVVERARRSPSDRRHEIRVYFCRGCDAWHTSSAPFTTAAQRRALREQA